MRAFLMMISIFTLTACGSESYNQQARPAPPFEITDVHYNDSLEYDQFFNFTSFHLKVDYREDLTFTVNYEIDPANQIKANIEELNNVELRDEEAFNQLSTTFNGFTFNEYTKEDEVIDEVIETFDLDPDFNTFELAVEYENGERNSYYK
ncbi:YusW family protein [Halobacillus sp. A1]|uniref:YusW family protein n=1 Tax=Halobacillus sp. A1 TaxID=2880262 RepID=UPI0020A6B3DF|nr:YusW family protein [Halobacillus sp. A1]MCP3031643.1 YusW family protein [Halobacillus sp. A1]